MKKKIFLLFFALLLQVTTFSSLTKAQAQTFSDVPPTAWYFQPVENGVTRKYISPAQTYRPEDRVRRSEMAKMLTIFGGFRLDSSASINFKDVSENEWYTPYVKTLVSNAIVKGYLDENGTATGYFGPADFVTRNQAATLLNRILKLDSTTPLATPFKDLTTSHWAYKDAMALYQAGIIQGYADGTYRGDLAMNRAEMAKLLAEAYPHLAKKLVSVLSNPLVTQAALYNEPLAFSGPDGLTLTGRIFKPEGIGPFPAVVFMHGCSGLLTGGSRTNALASQYVWWGETMAQEDKTVALFVDSFTPRNITDGVCGDGTILSEVIERPKDAYAGLAYLRTLNYVKPQNIGLMGWSNGGSAVLSAMAKNNNSASVPTAGGFVTAIAEYPGCGLRSYYGTDYSTENDRGTYLPYAPLIILAAEKDTTAPPSPRCVNLVDQAKQLGASDNTGNSIRLNIYEGAEHSFDGVKRDTASAADLVAQEASRNVVRGHFRSHLGG